MDKSSPWNKANRIKVFQVRKLFSKFTQGMKADQSMKKSHSLVITMEIRKAKLNWIPHPPQRKWKRNNKLLLKNLKR